MSGSARGALATAAGRVGASPTDYAHRIVAGEKWCVGCKDWHQIDEFGSDASRPDGRAATCLSYRRGRYAPRERAPRLRGFLVETRDGDKRQARRRVNYLVEQGRIPPPNALPCTDCGHVWEDGGRRHEYDHASGYGVAEQLTVEAVCSACHHTRERARNKD